MKYFGPECSMKEGETLVDTPVGVQCIYCESPILAVEMGTLEPMGPLHYECHMRMIVGSVGHQLKQCSCFGGTLEDPEGLTKREASIVAYKLYRGIYTAHDIDKLFKKGEK